MRTITMEHYRDFIGTLAHKKASLNTEIKAWDHAWERGEVDYCDYFEYEALTNQYAHYNKVQEFFLDNTERWVNFGSLDDLKAYVGSIHRAYKAMNEYSKAVLPVDGQDTIGVTYKEWDHLETMRNELSNKSIAWSTFAEFCEYVEV